MSAVTTEDLAPLGSWLPDFDAAAAKSILAMIQSAHDVRTATRLVDEPLALRLQFVHANVCEEGAAPERVCVGLAQTGELVCHCTCLVQEPLCAHVACLVRELAASEPLRARLVLDSDLVSRNEQLTRHDLQHDLEATPVARPGNRPSAPTPALVATDNARVDWECPTCRSREIQRVAIR